MFDTRTLYHSKKMLSKELYRFHRTTKEYLGVLGEAQIDPLESAKAGTEIYVVPPLCTLVPPIPFNPRKHENIIFNETKSAWERVEDYKGEEGYNKITGAPIIITKFGPLPEYFTYEKPGNFQEEKMKKFNELVVAYGEAQKEQVVFGQVTGNVDMRVKIQTLIDTAGPLDYVTLDLDDGTSVVLTIRQAKNAVKFFSVRNILLPIRKAEIAEKIKATRTLEELKEVEIDFDILDEIKKVVKMSAEKINEYIAGKLG